MAVRRTARLESGHEGGQCSGRMLMKLVLPRSYADNSAYVSYPSRKHS